MNLIFLLVSFLASVAGGICGIGGGVIIKPVLDAIGIMDVSSISFLSGCTVLSMSIISVMKSLKRDKSMVNLKTGTSLALGAAIGGILGKEMFQYVYLVLPDKDKVGAIQAVVLVFITISTLLYTIYSYKIKTHHIENLPVCAIIGLFLGILSTFLGIGGGPINLVVLTYFFSMDMKSGAVNSLYIIMFSQFTSLVNTVIGGTVPKFSILVLVLMVIGGVAGGMVGSKVNKTISIKNVNKLFITLMVVIIFINIYNAVKFSIGF
ncbi:hypothetical protein EDD66_11159 [Mobilisporobacter senegalensis]|uniref:Probable membrane transporter protein n=1 Tax=Mobilisporobacter senegalensis TaxID=1329262 RepID=A0A3N1XKN7_9FIRM|nr:sulfite exporter TauE/SafE family protein [Mobilisporobacter senegalensis]ROR25297.1 hypothetical protein EDD66_11159 [Mobilisporobacter senegalensis]